MGGGAGGKEREWGVRNPKELFAVEQTKKRVKRAAFISLLYCRGVEVITLGAPPLLRRLVQPL